MKCCSSTIDQMPLAAKNPLKIQAPALPQLNIVMCRVRWILTPEPSDERFRSQNYHERDIWGAVKALFWLGASIGIGVMLAGLGG